MMRCLSLFSGIGGLDLAAEVAGMQTIAFCERDEFCRRVLAAHWPGVPIYDDICTLDAGRLRADGLGAIDLIHGGFPCQDISNAGKRAGIDGERSGLWREFARLIGEVRPRYVVVENVAALLVRGLDRVLGDLAEIGYDAEWTCLRAADVGAPHKRERVFSVAESWRRAAPLAGGDGATRPLAAASIGGRRSGEHDLCAGQSDTARGGVGQADAAGAGRSGAGSVAKEPGRAGPAQCGAPLAHAASGGRGWEPAQRAGDLGDGGDARRAEGLDFAGERPARPRWPAEPGVGGGADGLSAGLDGRWPADPSQAQHEWEPPRTTIGKLPARSHRLRALGNAVVPAQAYPVFAAIAAWEAGE